MNRMTSAPVEPADLLDLKLLPAWVKERADARDYQDYAGEDEQSHLRTQRDRRGKRPSPKRARPAPGRKGREPRGFKHVGAHRRTHPPQDQRQSRRREDPPETARAAGQEVTIRFLSYAAPLQNVVTDN